MSKTALYIVAALLLAAVAIFHSLAMEYQLYWTYRRWLDIPAHLLSGLVIGLTCSIFFAGRYSFPTTGALVLMAILFIGGAWEVIEYYAGITALSYSPTFDTAKDILNDTLGAMLGFLMVRFLYNGKRA